MKAAVITGYGDTSVFHITDLPMPHCGSHEVLIKINGASVNPIDWKIRRGMLRYIIRPKFPTILGYDIAGEIIAVGNEVKNFAQGDFVFAWSNKLTGEGYAQYIALDEANVVLAPENMNAYQAASVPMAGETALQIIRDIAQVKAGQNVLIIGAAGGVGLFAVQLAKFYGAEVTAICSAAHHDLVKEHGADNVLCYDKEVLFSDNTASYDVVVDAVDKYSFPEMKPFLKPSGIYISTMPSFHQAWHYLLTRFQSKKSTFMVTQNRPADLAFLAKLLREDKIRPVIDSIYRLEDIRAAHQYSELGHAHGKIIINPYYFDTVEEASKESFPASDAPAW